jgi:hypothetical protein
VPTIASYPFPLPFGSHLTLFPSKVPSDLTLFLSSLQISVSTFPQSLSSLSPLFQSLSKFSSPTPSSSSFLGRSIFLHVSFYKSWSLFVPKESASTSRSRKTKDTLGYDLISQSAHKAERKSEPTIGYSIWIAVEKHG